MKEGFKCLRFEVEKRGGEGGEGGEFGEERRGRREGRVKLCFGTFPV